MVLVLFSPYFKAPSVCFTLFIPHYRRPVKAMTLTGVLRDVWIFIRKKQSFVGRRMKSGCASSSRSRQPDIWSKGLLAGLEDDHNCPASTSCSIRNSSLFLCVFSPLTLGLSGLPVWIPSKKMFPRWKRPTSFQPKTALSIYWPSDILLRSALCITGKTRVLTGWQEQ